MATISRPDRAPHAPPGPAAFLPPKYEHLRVLGSGGMGTVMLTRDRFLGRLVAVKVLRESCGVFLERLQREARTMARLAHRSIVNVHELGFHRKRVYLAMEYIDGGSLMTARLDATSVARALRDVADALAFAHARGIVHRDVKPENVLLDARGRAYLSDFGLALAPDEGSAREHGRPVVGTPLAMSPEQSRGEPVGFASDVFSLGVTAYHALAGKWPFRGRTVADVLVAIQDDEPEPLRELLPDLPRRLASIVETSLRKDPAERFASMNELCDELDRFLAPRPLLQRAADLFRRSNRPSSATRPRIHPPRTHQEETR